MKRTNPKGVRMYFKNDSRRGYSFGKRVYLHMERFNNFSFLRGNRRLAIKKLDEHDSSSFFLYLVSITSIFVIS